MLMLMTITMMMTMMTMTIKVREGLAVAAAEGVAIPAEEARYNYDHVTSHHITSYGQFLRVRNKGKHS